MNRHDDRDPGFDPRVADWLEADPDAAPEAVLDTVLAAFPSIPQRRSARLRWRPPTMNRFAYLAAATATIAVSIVAVAAGGLFTVTRPTVVASATPTGTALLSPSPSLAASPLPSSQLARNGQIAIVRNQQLVLVDPVTSKTTKVLVDRPAAPRDTKALAATDLSWAPDGRRLAYVSADGPIHVIDVSTGADELILNCGIEVDGCGIAWAPDGGRIAVTYSAGLDLIDPDGGNRQVLLQVAGPVGVTWSPDGRRVAVTANDGLFVVDRDGSDLATLIDQGLGVGSAAWSPDGKSIAYLEFTGHQHEACPRVGRCGDGERELHAMILDLDRSKPRLLVEAGVCFCPRFAAGLTWAPDGTSLAMVIPTDDFGLNIVNANGSSMRFVADGDLGPAAWQPVP